VTDAWRRGSGASSARSSVRTWARRVAEMPAGVRWALLAAAVLHGVGIAWGMPASDGWDVDGIAPRDVLPGLAETFSPGHYYTYPPLQLAIVGVLTLPVTLAAVVRAGSTRVDAVLPVVLGTPYMTAIAMVARVLSFVMSLGIVAAVAGVAHEIAPRPRKRLAATAAAWAATVDAPLTYYAHVTNVDVPYLFWTWLAILSLTRAIARDEPRRLRAAALLAALAIATKDQAYAAFMLSTPLAVAAWVAIDRRRAATIAREAGIAAALAVVLVLAIDGALTNPSGFRARLAFLSGSASQDYATYSADAAGRWSAFLDTARAFDFHYPWPVACFAVLGLALALPTRGAGGRARLAALVPLLVAASFTLAFNLVARRVEERFTLVQMLAASVYAGLGAERALEGFGARFPPLRWAGHAAVGGALALAMWRCARVDATMLRDPRYDAEAWLREHARPHDSIEAYGLNVYLIRFAPSANVTRVGPPEVHRNPMPGVQELEAPLVDIARRDPRYAVANECSFWQYFRDGGGPAEGRIPPQTLRRSAADADATTFFQGLFAHRWPYHLAHESRVRSRTFPRVELHASLGCPIYIFERDPIRKLERSESSDRTP